MSGSRAAFSIVVTPRASTAAVIMFSVAPTLGKSKSTDAPTKPLSAVATTYPCSICALAPSISKPLM